MLIRFFFFLPPSSSRTINTSISGIHGINQSTRHTNSVVGFSSRKSFTLGGGSKVLEKSVTQTPRQSVRVTSSRQGMQINRYSHLSNCSPARRCLMKTTMMSLRSPCTRQTQQLRRLEPAGSSWMRSHLDQYQTRCQLLGASLCLSPGTSAHSLFFRWHMDLSKHLHLF